ncbi:hypothetical protein, partial [Corallococcus exiguus]|uniref:hypothetical protein n=1 Tax=Corallococcus exiguus TaxID=83462 RepID=UPI001B8C4C54
MEDVVSAAREAGLPQDYLQSLEVWLPNATAAATSVPQPAQSRVRPIWGAPTSTLGRQKGG